MKRVIIIHGWGGHPNEAWIPWLKRELLSREFEVSAPEMPDTDYPRIDAWNKKLSEIIGEPNEDTYLVGHSIGCQSIIRYLAGLTVGRVGKVVLVAPWVTLHDLDSDDEEIARPWLDTPLEYEKARLVAGHVTAIFSDDDPDVPLENKNIFAERLGADIVIEHHKGHFSVDSGVTELPVVLDVLI